MGLRLDQLPAEMRRRAEKALEAQGGRRRSSRRELSLSDPCPGRCSCGAAFGSYAAWEKHADAEGAGHRRWRLDVAPKASAKS